MIAAVVAHENKINRRHLSGLVIYKPFILGLCLVFIGTYTMEILRSDGGTVGMHQLMNAFMGFFFIVFASPKFFNLSGFADTFKQYDIISQRFPNYALAFPFIELTLGLVLLNDVSGRSSISNLLINVTIALIAGTTLLGVVSSLRQKKQLDCACMGSAFKFPLSKVAVIENIAMLVMAVGMLLAGNALHMVMISLTHFKVMN